MISFAARASNMENDIEQARASNMEEDKASSPNKGKFIDVGNASDIEMATNILEKLDTEMPLQRNGSESGRSECCIYTVPRPLRHVNWEAYAPQLISIGPLHRENKSLEAMEKEKRKYFKNLTERDGMDKKKKCDIVISIKNQEERLRHCYSEKFKKIESSDFVEMILLDAVFIIQFFLESNDEKGPKNFKPRMTFDIREDLMLLENQLPLFIIEKIYDQVSYHSSDNKPKSFLDLATFYLKEYLHLEVVETSPGVEKETSPDVKKEPRHLTDLLRNLMLSGANKPSYSFNPVKLKYSAVRLHKAGVKFQVITQDKCLVNITFHRGVLKIPKLEVDHNFERLVRNIMAMEQCLYKSEAYICSYIKFMDQLIDSAEDVGLLVEKGIIVHRLGDDAAVSNMISHFCENMGDSYTCFSYISQRLNAHYDNRFNLAVASVATISLILTLIQTISTVISLFLA